MRSTILFVALALCCAGSVRADEMIDCFGHLHRAELLRDQGQYLQALAEVDVAMRIGKSRWRQHCLYDRSKIWFATGEYDKAIADAEEATGLSDGFSACRKHLGEVWIAKGDFDKAIANFDLAFEDGPQVVISIIDTLRDWNAEVLACRAEARSKKGDYDGAIEDFNESLRRDARQASTFQKAAWFRATCPDESYRDGERALTNAKKAYELSGELYASYGVFETLAAAYAESGDFHSAIQWEKKAIAMKPRTFGFKAAAEKRLLLYQAHQPYWEEAVKQTQDISTD